LCFHVHEAFTGRVRVATMKESISLITPNPPTRVLRFVRNRDDF
jgi:hypothetical protein